MVTGDAAARAVLSSPDVTHWRRPPDELQDAFEAISSRWMGAVLPGPDAVLREGLTPLLSAAAIDRIARSLQRLADRLLDVALPAGRMEVVSQYATPLALHTACVLLGLHRDESGDLARLHYADLTGTLEDVDRPSDLSAMLQAALDARAEGGDGLLAVVAGAASAGRIDPRDAVPFARFFLFALLDNTVGFVGNAVAALAGDSASLDALTTSGADDVVEELLRRDGPVHFVRVTTVRDVEVEGVVVPSGEDVLVCLAAANRDPERYAAPDAVCPARGAHDHLAFGWGRGYCVGARLARREATVALTALAARVGDVRLAGALGPLRPRPEVLHGRQHLDVLLEPRAGGGTDGP